MGQLSRRRLFFLLPLYLLLLLYGVTCVTWRYSNVTWRYSNVTWSYIVVTFVGFWSYIVVTSFGFPLFITKTPDPLPRLVAHVFGAAEFLVGFEVDDPPPVS